MTRYENLVIFAENLGAKVKEIDFGTNKKCGRYINHIIYINSRMSEKEKYEILSEEIGHYKTTFGNITNQNEIQNKKLELIARRYGNNFALKPLDIVHAMKCGCKNEYDIAEFYELSINQISDIMNDFKKLYGLGKRFGKYFITFEPTFAFVKMFDNNLERRVIND